MSDLIGETAAKIEAHWQSWRSVEIDTRIVQKFIVRPKDKTNLTVGVDEHYIETAAGQRFLDARARYEDGSQGHRQAYRDGMRCANVAYWRENPDEQQQVIINRTFDREWVQGPSARPVPLRHFYAGGIPLHEAILKAEPAGDARVLDRDCNSFVIRDLPNAGGRRLTLLYKLDKKEAVPLEVDGFLGDGYAKGEPRSIWRATRLETRQGRLVAVESEEMVFDVRNPSQQTLAGRMTVRSIAFDKDYPRSTFWPTIQPGVNVIDSLAREIHLQPGVRKEVKVEDPVRVAPDAGARVPIAGISLGLGLAMLAAGLVLRRRRG